MTDWDARVLALAASVVPDIPRIRVVLDQLGIRNADYEDPGDYVASAFVNAAGRRKVLAFQAALVKEGLVVAGPAGAAAAIEQGVFDRLASLQTFSSAVYAPTDARVAARRMLLACDLVCRIDVDEKQAGTGVLVAPTLVATAAHVVQDLVDLSDPTAPVARPDSTRLLTVTFGDVADLLDDDEKPTRLPGRQVSLSTRWLAYFSPPAPNELTAGTFVLDSVEGIGAEGPWDVAILRLAERQPFHSTAPRKRLPRKPFQVHVLHHPSDGRGQGLPMLWSIGRVDRRLGDPPLRLLHSANTSGGSSGAPVFDAEFRVVGLHQAGRLSAPVHEDEANNRAVPVVPWAPRLAALELPEAAPPVPSVELVDEAGATVTRVVIGRAETRDRIWRGMGPGTAAQDRLLAVLAPTPGLGLRFTKHLVHALVTPFGGAYAALDVANAQGDDAETFAAKVAGAFAADVRAPGSMGLTTRQRDTRNRTAPALAETLNRIAGQSGAWLVLEGFESSASRPSAAVVDLVRQLVLELPHAAGIRLVLAGWQESLPSGFEACVEYLVPPTVDDIARTLLPWGTAEEVVATLRPLVGAALAASQAAKPGAGPYVVAEDARRDLALTLGPFISALAAPGVRDE
jgi:hypothetical protein